MLLGIDGVLLLAVIALLHWMLYAGNGDILVFYQPWYEHIVRFGRWASLEGSYANYNPPYLYLLSCFTVLYGHLPTVVIIKLVEVPGVLAAGLLVWSIVRALGHSNARAVLTGCLIALAPEVVANTLLWGQVDMLYTVFLLLMTRLLLAKRPYWAMATFGVALAVKLQAIFVGPALLAMLLAGELPWTALLPVPAVYAAMMLPAWLAGRPAKELLLIYRNQVTTFPEIAKNVANPYQVLEHWAAFSLPETVAINKWGAVLAILLATALIVLLVRAKTIWQGRGLIAAMASPLLLLPFVLPKMHDRYYFCGNVLLLLLATLDVRMIVPALLTQASALAVYYRFMTDEVYYPRYYILPALMVLVALGLFLRAYLFSSRAQGAGTASRFEKPNRRSMLARPG